MDVSKYTDNLWFKVIITGIVILLSWITLKKIRASLRTILLKPYYSITEYEKDTLYVFIFERKIARQLINLSPFAVKLETWLRLKKLPYKVVETNQFSKSTGQIPFILYNGQEVADTDLIIDFLTKTFDLEKDDLDPEMQGVARAFSRMVDDGLSLTHFKFRYNYFIKDFYGVYFQMFDKDSLKGKLFAKLIRSGIVMNFKTGTVGRHPPEAVGKIGQKDIRAISRYLGNKQFMFGDKITTVDCAIFGQLSQIIYLNLNFPHKEVLQSECKNIKPYIDRIRAALWSDWDEIVCMEPFD